MKKPKVLRLNDIVGIVAPAESFDRNNLAAGIELIRSWGFRVRYNKNIFKRHWHFAGSARMRAMQVNRMFADPQVRAIFCASAGYGTGRILPLLDHDVIKANPKIIVGYSDITLLLIYCQMVHKMVTFHGPVVAGELHEGMSRQTANRLYGMLIGVSVPFRLLENVEVLHAGKAEGMLVGGNLSRLCETLGTFYEVRTKKTIMFLEDIAVNREDFDAFITHLHACGKLQELKGIIVGTLRDENGRYLSSEVVMTTLQEIAAPLHMPIVGTRRCGHGRINLTLPLGVRVRIDTTERSVVLLESPVR